MDEAFRGRMRIRRVHYACTQVSVLNEEETLQYLPIFRDVGLCSWLSFAGFLCTHVNTSSDKQDISS
jgi:hypothetical protein